MAANINVLVVDDSAFMRKVITDILDSAEDIKVIGKARNGIEALQKAKQLRPDVMTLDLEMPKMDGLCCLKELQKDSDMPVIILSSHTSSGKKTTIEALEAGAVDFVAKPEGIFEMLSGSKKEELVEKIRVAKNIVTGKRTNGRKSERQSCIDKTVGKSSILKTIVAIGTSTGGPRALQEVVPYIPGNVPAAFLIVQHMPSGFTKSLAERLNVLSELTVKEAEDAELIKPGYAYIAPGDYHLGMEKSDDATYRIKLTHEPVVGGHRPSVNVMMDSVASTGFPNVVGVIMTGMGNDGSSGIVNLKKCNKAKIIAQDEKSCVVYGMPRAAALTGAVDSVVPLKGIAAEIVKNLGA